uniref:LysM domain-containing protein n=1 Tax=Nelumbo nucifera TaxID=4432 RepID=A0A822ZP44_NELNU|nr:TPA_asm: hypothetical protein HUJ06_016510 [Nelumbo nucifera]
MKMRKSDKLPLLIAYLSVFAITARAQSFKCSGSTTKCQALAGYISPNKTTLADIQTMFGVVRLQPLLGANSLPLNTTSEYSVAAGETIKIPFPCTCDNGTGVSDRVPVYKIKKNDGLYHIAAEVFSGLVQYPQIAAVNNISNVDLIKEGDELRIPLPCSCDNVDGLQVVHYAHVVANGSSVEQIAQKFGTSNTTLLSLNGITNPKDLKAGQVLDVPLRACASKVRNDSLDYPLSVANGTYTLTANNCVQCKCDSSNNFTSKQFNSRKPHS